MKADNSLGDKHLPLLGGQLNGTYLFHRWNLAVISVIAAIIAYHLDISIALVEIVWVLPRLPWRIISSAKALLAAASSCCSSSLQPERSFLLSWRAPN